MTVTDIVAMLSDVGRWEPNAQGRLQEAALELFGEHGYEQTSVAEIAERAGLSERTFFRHYADKREVLFGATDDFREAFVVPMERAATGLSPLELVSNAVEGAGAALEQVRGREFARARQRVIIANPELRERELIKLADVTAAMAVALRARGVEDPDASMLAELGMAAFRVAFERWVAVGEQRTLPELIAAALASVAARPVSA